MMLRQARKAAKLTQKEVADYVGINQNTYSYWENGKIKVDSISIQKLAELFKTTVDYLLSEPQTAQTSKHTPAAELAKVAYDKERQKDIDETDTFKKVDYVFGQDIAEILKMLVKLDAIDQAEIRGEIKGMLRNDKYKKQYSSEKAG